MTGGYIGGNDRDGEPDDPESVWLGIRVDETTAWEADRDE